MRILRQVNDDAKFATVIWRQIVCGCQIRTPPGRVRWACTFTAQAQTP